MIANRLFRLQGLQASLVVQRSSYCNGIVNQVKKLSSQDVQHLQDIHEFRIEITGHSPAYLRYNKKPGEEIDLYTTVVPTSLEGNGVAKILTKAALQFAREEDLPVRPTCWYVEGFLKRNPQQDLKIIQLQK
eukprot:TRINITY_DN7040_c0_g1_i2.p1 TRINITY_DN7040_c0_g1~~TRINITY_DN7040_c0_g1_i2.p1  ORF type:complete len:132 (-),score=17.55 TRINITY_DN7040_c0_g1_i2:226-621(-)